VNTGSIANEIQYCKSIVGFLKWTDLGDQLELQMQDEVIDSTFEIVNNQGNLTLVFLAATTINGGTFTVRENHGPFSVSFPNLQSLDGNVSVIFQGNADLQVISLPVLISINSSCSFVIEDNDGLASFQSSLTTLLGNMTIQNNTLETIQLDTMLSMNGFLTISDHSDLQQLSIQSLFSISGNLQIQNNQKLEIVLLSNLVSCPGLIWIQNNPNLGNISIPNIVNGQFNLDISENQGLQDIDLSRLQAFVGKISIANNTNLNSIRIANLAGMDINSRLEISDNFNLITLNLRAMICGSYFTIILSNNVNLQKVIVGADCQNLILITGSPNVLFENP